MLYIIDNIVEAHKQLLSFWVFAFKHLIFIVNVFNCDFVNIIAIAIGTHRHRKTY